MSTSNGNAPDPRKGGRFLLLGGVVLVPVLLVGFWYAGGWRATPEIPGGNLTEGDPEVVAALSAARQAVAREPNSAKAWGLLGQILHVHNYLGPAQVCYGEAMNRDNRDPAWPYLRGVISQVGAEPATALPDLRIAAELGSLKNLPRLRLGELLLDLGEHDQAEAEFRKVLAARASDPRANLGLARVALARQQWDAALEHLLATQDVPFAQKEIHSLLLIAYQRLGNQPEVKRQHEWLTQIPEDRPWPDPVVDSLARHQVGVRPRVIRAMQTLRQGNADAGLKALQDLTRDYPDSDMTWTALGRAWALVGQSSEAEKALRHSLNLAPNTGDVWMSLGLVYQKQNKHAAALECFQKVNQLKPTDAEGHSRAADCLRELGQGPEAIASYRRALACQPDHREALEGLDRLLAKPPGRP